MHEMKDSGIDWIGSIPYNWEIKRLKDIKADIPYAIVDGPFGSAISTNDYVEKGVPLIRIVNIEQPGLTSENIRYITKELAIKVKRSTVYRGDIILAKTGATVGKCGINDLFDNAILSSSCIKISIASCHSSEFFFYFFYTDQFNQNLRNSCNGTTRDTINLKPFGEINCCLPPFLEQEQIVSVLEKKCSQVDNLIVNVESQIEKLKAYKQSLITETVTKGLDKSVPMKDSGVEWIGNIPINWKVLKFGFCAKVNSNLVDPMLYQDYQQISPDSIEKNSCNLISNKTVKEAGVVSWNHFFTKGTIIYSKVRPLLNKVVIAPFDGLCSADMYPIETDNQTKFVVYLMLSNSFTEQVALVTQDRVKMPKINQDELAAIKVALPPSQEQCQIVDFLDKACAQIDQLISIKQQKIDKLNQYKKSIIYEYVTGKKEVVNG